MRALPLRGRDLTQRRSAWLPPGALPIPGKTERSRIFGVCAMFCVDAGLFRGHTVRAFGMAYSGRSPAPLWAQSLFVGTFILVSMGLLMSAVLWVGVPQSGIILAFEGIVALVAFLGIVLIAYGLQLRRRGPDRSAVAKTAPERNGIVRAPLRDGATQPPRTRTR